MKIEVLQCDWGNAAILDINLLLEDTAFHLNRLLRTPFDGPIQVFPALRDSESVPKTYYRSSSEDPFVIRLATWDKYWARYAYQFAHEFCHVLSGYERLKENPNNWFHETLCEVASMFVLRHMAHRWATNPPFPNWAEFAGTLWSYAEDRMSRQEVQLPEGITLASWISFNEDGLRSDPYQRDKNDVAAYSLLPIFEGDPAGWNAIRRLPESEATLRDYLVEWQSAVDFADKDFVTRLSETLC